MMRYIKIESTIVRQRAGGEGRANNGQAPATDS